MRRAGIAQLVEQAIENRRVPSSNLGPGMLASGDADTRHPVFTGCKLHPIAAPLPLVGDPMVIPTPPEHAVPLGAPQSEAALPPEKRSQIQAFFQGDTIRQLLDCDQAFIEHCNRLSYKAEPSSDPELVSPTMGRALLEIALGFCELAHDGSSDKGLYDAACTINAVVCDHDGDGLGATDTKSLALKRLLGSRGGMTVAQTITRVLVKVDQLDPWGESHLSDIWRSLIHQYCRILGNESSLPIPAEHQPALIERLLQNLFGS